jgi:hypothetical protein
MLLISLYVGTSISCSSWSCRGTSVLLCYKLNFIIFIYNSSTYKILMHGTEFIFHTGLQLLFRATLALFWMQFILVGRLHHFGNCLDIHYKGIITTPTPVTKAEAVFEKVESHRIVKWMVPTETWRLTKGNFALWFGQYDMLYRTLHWWLV